MGCPRRTTLHLAAAFALALLPGTGRAQGQAPEPTASDLALAWAVGRYVAPVVCPLPAGPARLARNLRIDPPRRASRRVTLTLEIEPIGTGEARCTDELGEEEPELRARAQLSFRGSQRRDIGRHEFEQALRREGGFRYHVDSGLLELGAGEGQRSVDLEGASLEIRAIEPGSDAARMLGDVGPLAKRVLVLEASDGTRVVIRAVHAAPRR